jgi:diguanylate cyclase (GGDEF)-like protein/PAS domain S-box-containing protein
LLKFDLTQFLEACPTAAFAVGPDDRILSANRAAQTLFGRNDPLQWEPASQLIPQWPSSGATFQALIRDGSGEWSDCKITMIRKLGEACDITVALIAVETSLGRALEAAKLRLQFVIDMLPQAICVFDHEDRYVLWNRRYSDLYAEIAQFLRPGIPFEEILKISLASGEMLEVIGDGELWLKQRMEKFRRPTSQEEQQLCDGRWLRHDDRRTPDGGAIGMRIDITELKQREIWLRELFEANPMPMLLCDGEHLAILQANNAAVEFYGFSKPELSLKTAIDLHVEEQKTQFGAALTDLGDHCNARTVWLQQASSGKTLHVLIYVRLIYEGTAKRLLLTIADVSDRVHAESEANRLAHHDALTGLPNRILFYKKLEEAITAGNEAELVVYCLDLDGFKPVNDTFGHAAGDAVLKQVAERLREQAGDRMVARLGGDEFAFLFRAQGDSKTDLASRCIAALEIPFSIKGLSIKIGLSIGIASSLTDGADSESLLHAADRALYFAKAAGRGTWKLATDDPAAWDADETTIKPRHQSA